MKRVTLVARRNIPAVNTPKGKGLAVDRE